MGYFYFDESIHDDRKILADLKFILGAFVYSEIDLGPLVFEAITKVGLEPEVDEYKSSSTKINDPKQVELRDRLGSILRRNARLGIVIAPASERRNLGSVAMNGLEKFIKMNNLTSQSHRVFFDQEITVGRKIHADFIRQCDVCTDQDSKLCAGIQIADFASHYMATMLKEELGLFRKTVFAGEASGYDPDTEMNLGFELWVGLRYSFFCGPFSADQHRSDDQTVMATFDVANYGLHISSICSDELREAALARFGRYYLGCIH
ncbi:DUF3800 domain-containing protein [Mesorhizobium sp. M1423]|uniref:DUF3800 domain-containing protein n=1 Tax=Mesorhizobium sp. M1423 TaxID=2957101 RepID=UPI00333A18DF